MVGGQGLGLPAELPEEQFQVGAAVPDVLHRVIEELRGSASLLPQAVADPLEGVRGQLHQSPGVHRGPSRRGEAALAADDGVDQGGVQPAGGGLLLHDGLVAAR